ncbi:hypothetical protein ACLBKU_07565 [Erythrobacter sp. NE805]|uniref:hypothetical protein n=1 Tax=Erythrobacter sp. NE805 TaxID=3389875 RepID=UPI00396B1906
MNLLPEGEPLRAVPCALGAATEDALRLIAQTGNDLAGALNIATRQPRDEPDYRPNPDAGALERIIEELPGQPHPDGGKRRLDALGRRTGEAAGSCHRRSDCRADQRSARKFGVGRSKDRASCQRNAREIGLRWGTNVQLPKLA